MIRGSVTRFGAAAAAAVLLAAIGTRDAARAGPAARDPDVVAHVRSAETAKGAGDIDGAEREYLRALSLDPAAADVMAALIALRDDKDRRALFAYQAALTGCDDRGTFKFPRDWAEIGKDDLAAMGELVKLRAKAARATASATTRLRGAVQAPGLWYLDGLARLLAQGSPALEALQSESDTKLGDKLEADPEKVVKALRAVVLSSTGPGQEAVALEAARILRGLHQQKGQKDAKNTGVGEDAEIAKVQQVIDRIRAQQKASEIKVWTVAELAAIPEAERPAWNAEHASWNRPGVALSTTGLYRIETVCGLETLMIAADEVELHHRRLATWMGKDPFKDRQGTIRLCDSYADMESEGEPFWWAGGWQRGDVTTVLVNFADNAGLGSLLTHELTHRFDGMLHVNLPTWMVEGRAVYTESCSPNPGATTLDERVYLSGRLWEAQANNYCFLEKLPKLLSGDIEDYRHNYDAGYALWLFLVRFRGFDVEQDKPPLYAPRVPDYIESFRKQMQYDPTKRFVEHFCDGKDGRPSSLAALCTQLTRFWREGSQGGREPEWRKRWTEDNDAAARSLPPGSRRYIYDRPASPRSRERHDPPDYGQYHAYSAGRLFQSLGRRADAFEAYAWALAVDELNAKQLAEVTAFLEEEGSGFVPWVIQHRMQRARPLELTAPPGPAPGTLSGAWRSSQELCDRLAELEGAYREGKRTALADALRAEHDLLAAWLGSPVLGPTGKIAEPTRDIRELTAPFCPPYVGALLGGVVAERWAPLDSQEDIAWNRPSPSSIELGRDATDAATTGQIRDARVRRVFVRGERSYAGTYTFRTRVRFMSAYAEARLVVGHTHRDRGVEIRLSGGDYNYAVGESSKGYPLSGVSVGIGDLRPFDWEQSPLYSGASFDSPKDTFDVTVHVAGPYVRVLVNDHEIVTHRVTTGQPIEGHIGYGLYRGIVRFEEPEVRVHRAHGPMRACACGTFDEPLTLDKAAQFPWSTAVGRRVEGIERNAYGSMLVWFTEKTPYAARISMIVKGEVDTYRQPFVRDDLPVSVHVLIPKPPDGEVPSAAARFPTPKELDLPAGTVHTHSGQADLLAQLAKYAEEMAASEAARNGGLPMDEAIERANAYVFGTPVWIMLDDQNVIRACAPEASPAYSVSLAHRLAGW